ncbi:MAG TPA: hypothetical protein V6C97_04415 [Oculatellaceae cyanobacterium]
MNYSFASANNRNLSQPAIVGRARASLVIKSEFGNTSLNSFRAALGSNGASPRYTKLLGGSLEIRDTQRAI